MSFGPVLIRWIPLEWEGCKYACNHRIDDPVGRILFGYSLAWAVGKELPLTDWITSSSWLVITKRSHDRIDQMTERERVLIFTQ